MLPWRRYGGKKDPARGGRLLKKRAAPSRSPRASPSSPARTAARQPASCARALGDEFASLQLIEWHPNPTSWGPRLQNIRLAETNQGVSKPPQSSFAPKLRTWNNLHVMLVLTGART